MIESIGGVATRDMPLAYASMLLRGESGTTVELSVVRTRHPEPTAVKLTRADFPLPAVESRMLADKVGYINVDALSPELVKQVASAVQQLQKDGAQKLMLDLRNCATGTPEDGIALANLFLNKGRITYLVGQKVPRQNFEADPAKAITTLPVAVLTNRGTADAAEVAAAALMDNKRAQVVGERTYGDAALRSAITMEDGGAIILSVAKYYSPDGKAIQDTGVTPNNVVSDADAQIDVDDNGEPLPEAAGAEKGQQKKVEDDAVVKKALEAARQVVNRDRSGPNRSRPNPGRDRIGASVLALQRLQISDQVVLLRIAQHVLIGRHAAPAFVDPGPDGGVRRFLPVGHFVFLEETFQPGTHLLLVAVRVVAHAALLEYGFALRRHRPCPRTASPGNPRPGQHTT